MFCSCANNPDEKRPNVNICPVCMGHPGTLPVLNKQAVQHVLLVGHAVGGKIADYTEWDRKNYFYPDIPKGYQISQYKYPIVSGGAIPIDALARNISSAATQDERDANASVVVGGADQRLLPISITRIHLEEDTAKSTHGVGKSADESLVDFNRAGVPLLELVTEPVIHDAETASAFAREFQLLLRTLGVAEANMEKGEMRVEANVSVMAVENCSVIPAKAGIQSGTSNSISNTMDSRLHGNDKKSANEKISHASEKLGTKTEVKNLNSFRSVERAIDFEIKRQIELLEKGEKVIQETRGWDENAGKTFSQRAKESSHDYRYFPDPDLPKLVISEIKEFSADEINKGMPELPWEKRARLIRDFSMTTKEAAVFVESLAVGRYFEEVVQGEPLDEKVESQEEKVAGNPVISAKAEIQSETSDSISNTMDSRFRGNDKQDACSSCTKLAINYILTDYLGLIKKDHDEDYKGFINTIEPARFAELMKMTSENKVSSRGAKDLLVLMYKGDKREPLLIAQEKGLLQKSDANELESMAKEIIAKNPSVVADYKSGKLAALQFLIGQGMKLSKGSANPAVLKDVFLKELK
jgi:aspartyl-tRNA(Asn)/glutamyl-tRNA(Gln) amidotransferase subunit B